MLIRVAVLNTFVWTIAGAPMHGSWPSLAPEPTAVSFEAAARAAEANSPVDETSRDFTAMIDISATGTHCDGGVRLVATSAPESKYFVEGHRGETSTHVPEDIRRLEQMARATTSGPRRGERVEIHARSRLRSLVGIEGPAYAALWRSVTAQLERVSMCFVAAPRASYRLRRNVTLVLSIGPDGRISRLNLRGSGTGDPTLGGCLRERLDPLLAAGVKPGSQISLKLNVAMQF